MKKNIPIGSLVLSLSFCALLLALRIVRSGELSFLFLAWNLFLAIIPYGITQILKTFPAIRKNHFMFWLVFGAWLAFFPNAPYIITDLQHLKVLGKQYIWFDVILISTFALNGLWLGLHSLQDIELLLQERFNKLQSKIVVVAICFLCGFGIYLGRFLRWNSWDILQEPLMLLDDILARIAHPLHYSQTWSFTFIFGSFLWVIYWIAQVSISNTTINKKQ